MPADLEGTLRFEHARPGRVLHLSAHLAEHARHLRRCYPEATVHVGRARGLEWLEEVRQMHNDGKDDR